MLEKCKYKAKEKKMLRYIPEDMEISANFDREDSDEKKFNEEN